MSYLPYLLAAWLFLIGFYGVVTSRHLVHLAVCLTVMQSSTYVLLLSIGYRTGGTSPIFKGIPLGTRVGERQDAQRASASHHRQQDRPCHGRRHSLGRLDPSQTRRIGGAQADRLRDEIRNHGWEVRDSPAGPELVPMA